MESFEACGYEVLLWQDRAAGNEGTHGRRQKEKQWQRMRCLDGIFNSIDMSLSKLQEIVKY